MASVRGPAPVRVRQVAGGYRLDGSVDWVTGWDLVDVVLVAALDDADVVHHLLVDAEAGPTLTADPVDVVTTRASRTVDGDVHRPPGTGRPPAPTPFRWPTGAGGGGRLPAQRLPGDRGGRPLLPSPRPDHRSTRRSTAAAVPSSTAPPASTPPPRPGPLPRSWYSGRRRRSWCTPAAARCAWTTTPSGSPARRSSSRRSAPAPRSAPPSSPAWPPSRAAPGRQ